MAKEQDFYGSNVADAIANACKELAAAQEDLTIEVLETGSPGIFGLCRKRARIRVSRKGQPKPAAEVVRPETEAAAPLAESAAPAKTPPKKKERPPREQKKPAPKPQPEKVERQKEAVTPPESKEVPAEELGPYVPPTAEALEAVRQDVAKLLELMSCPSSVTVELDNQTVACKVSGEHQDILTGQEGRTLDSLQYLLRKMTTRLLPDRTKLAIEVGDYRERRIEELKKRVLELAAQVRVDGMTQAIPALNPSERRAVHMLLQDDKEVRSRSVGEGLFKKVLIYKPGKKKPFPRKGGKGQQNDGPAED
ncbi:Jag N-terminal domain-containing protein [Candidatus Electronema sp. JM]|uniref:Jag N-terminal domain-containing protein n=1 Tax=Candidatus Electronema sp. JM TaxID=3401571 RepID=UPI003AA8B26B